MLLSCDAWPGREYADQLKASRDELAAASKTEVGSAALNTLEKRALLTQKASMEKMATEARRWVFWLVVQPVSPGSPCSRWNRVGRPDTKTGSWRWLFFILARKGRYPTANAFDKSKAAANSFPT